MEKLYYVHLAGTALSGPYLTYPEATKTLKDFCDIDEKYCSSDRKITIIEVDITKKYQVKYELPANISKHSRITPFESAPHEL